MSALGLLRWADLGIPEEKETQIRPKEEPEAEEDEVLWRQRPQRFREVFTPVVNKAPKKET